MARRKQVKISARDRSELKKLFVEAFKATMLVLPIGKYSSQEYFFYCLHKVLKGKNADLNSIKATIYEAYDFTPKIDLYKHFYDICKHLGATMENITYEELARRTGVSRPTILLWIEKGWLIGGRSFSLKDNIEHIKNKKIF
jgi:hypothetical protein